MTDIYDIKEPLLGSPINIIYSLLFFVFIIILFLLYKYLIKINEQKVLEEKTPEKIIEKDFKLELIDFENKYLNEKSDLFYSKLLDILKEIYYKNEKKNIESMTFEEINNLKIDKDLNELIKNMYYKEYAKNINDNETLRKSFIKKVRILI